MKRWQMSLGLAGTALAAALLAPKLFPFLTPQAPLPDPLANEIPPPQQIVEIVQTPEAPRHIDLVIAIDTSGSMERLIDSTRARLWDIVNEIDAADPNAHLRVGLMAYGTPSYGSENNYTKVVMPLTDDLDALYTAAWKLSTDGGDEYVGAVIDRAITGLEWSPADNPENRRLLFIAGNETARLGPIDIERSTRMAVHHDIAVSTLFAGNDNAGRTLHWADVATMGGGRYLAIDAARSAVAVTTPYDDKLQALNNGLNGTYLAGNSSGQERFQQMLDNDASSGSYGIGGLASRAASKSSGKFKTDSWDIVSQRDKGTLDLTTVDRNALPGDLRHLDDQELTEAIDSKAAKRQVIKKEIQALQQERGRFLKKKAKAEKGDGLDEAMGEMLEDLL